MKKIYAISLNVKREFLLYKASNKYTEQNIKDVYKVAQDWTAHLIKYAAYMRVELNEENVWTGLF